jgi:hypothetical protein
VKVFDVAPAVTVTDAGTINNALSLIREMTSPPAAAVAERFTVQVDEPLLARLAGIQTTELTMASGTKAMAKLCEVEL